MPRPDRRWQTVALVVALAVAALVFSRWPGLDLTVSALFYRLPAGFWLADLAWLETFRNLLWDLTIVTFVVAVVGVGLARTRRPLLGVGLGDWGYIAALYLLGPVLLVNVILKSHWGRARPADVGQFGGAHLFTPPLQPADQCASNCSFVSGEVAATVVMAIGMLVIAPALARWLPRWALRLWTGAAWLLPWLVALQRIATGRHFLSDSLFSALFMLALALLLAPIRTFAGRPRR